MDVPKILQVQSTLKRTPKGRHVGDALLPMLEKAIGAASSAETEFMDCDNCGFVLDSQSFAAGCPNCGCKDVSVINSPNAEKIVYDTSKT